MHVLFPSHSRKNQAGINYKGGPNDTILCTIAHIYNTERTLHLELYVGNTAQHSRIIDNNFYNECHVCRSIVAYPADFQEYQVTNMKYTNSKLWNQRI